MKRIVMGILSAAIILQLFTGCDQATGPDKNKNKIIDMAGREVEIPAEIEKVYATGSIGTIMVYTLAPEKLTGWNSPLSDDTKVCIMSEYRELPDLGSWKGPKYSGNIEELLKAKPDLIINMGDVSESYIKDTEEIQKQLNIPVVMVDGNIGKADEAYRFLGRILKKEDRAEKLGDYVRKTLEEVNAKIVKIPEDKRLALYYAEGLEGLETEVRGSLNSEIIDIAGAINVADPGTEAVSRRINVSLEQVLAWNPEIIIISTDGDKKHHVYNAILTGKEWQSIDAVRNKRVYEVPQVPFDWINRPPSISRIIGVKWLSNLLYPDMFNIDIEEETKEFFRLFYQIEPGDDMIKEILRFSR
ncbi:MAG: ABC transporter substrate-binding protein [Clostridiaceae bacterium]|nr:ABC transporter substrate-binding protein [Clostridiaceae bacterium]